MPKIDLAAVPKRQGVGYPPPFAEPCADRIRQRLGDAGGLRDFGVNLMHLPPGNWSSQRHWHSHEDEFVYVLSGEMVLIEDEGETILRAGDCAAFPKNTGNGHHMINRSDQMAVYLEAGSRKMDDLCTCSDIDMMSANADGRFVHKDGSPYDDLAPRFEQGKTLLLAGLSGRFGPAERDQIPALWMRWAPAWFGHTPGQADKKAYGACWNFDGKGSLDYLAGVEVESFDGLPAELARLTIEPRPYAVFAHKEHISAISKTWMHIYETWLPKSGRQAADAPCFELYDAEFDPNVAIGHVEIWIPLK